MNVQTKPVLNLHYVNIKVPFPINIVQFGTGVLLRGLIDYIFQLANEKGVQNAITMVKSTSSDIQSFKDQDCIYTIVASGLNEELLETVDFHIVSCIQAVLSAEKEWTKLESLFTTETLSIVVSNVTEAGLVYISNSKNGIPDGYPAKLAHLLYKRFTFFKGDLSKGLIVIPTELIVDNGEMLLQLVLRHSIDMGFPDAFRSWLKNCCSFCDSLVDRIVPGKWTEKNNLSLPYTDNLAVATEPYYLWAIKGNKHLQEYFSKYRDIPGFIVTDDLTPYREQKLRLLNGCHTLLAPIAYALGCKTVKEMMNNHLVYSLFTTVVENEILPTLRTISPNASGFYKQMILRWKNPTINHALSSILSQSITKMQIRNGDTFIRFYEEFDYLPPFLTFGFAIFLRVYQPKVIEHNKYFSATNQYPLIEFNDQKSDLLYSHWHSLKSNRHEDIKAKITSILNDENIFSHKFVSLPRFTDQVVSHYLEIEKIGLESSILNHLTIQSKK